MAQLNHNSTQEDYNKIISIDKISNDTINTIIYHTEEQNNNDINIDINDYEIADEEKEYGFYVDILNIFNIYFKTLYKKSINSTLFDDIDTDDIRSTNRQLEYLYEEIVKYKTSNNERYTELFDLAVYKEKYLNDDNKLPEDYSFYLVDINGIQKVTHNLITALKYIATFDWKNDEWSINKINEF